MAWLHGLTDYIHGLAWLQLMIDSFWSLLSAGLQFTLPLAILSFIGGIIVGIIRGAIISVPKGQWEASYSIGMSSSQAMRRVILPQSVFVSLPPLSNSFISLIKDTSLAAVITVPEMFLAAQRIVSVTYEPLILYVEAALIYLMFSTVLGKLQNRLEIYYRRYE